MPTDDLKSYICISELPSGREEPGKEGRKRKEGDRERRKDDEKEKGTCKERTFGTLRHVLPTSSSGPWHMQRLPLRALPPPALFFVSEPGTLLWLSPFSLPCPPTS